MTTAPRCIMFLLFLVVAGVIALVIVKVINPNKKHIAEAAANLGINGTQITDQISSGLQQAGSQVAAGMNTITRGVAQLGGGGPQNGTGGGGSSAGQRRRLFEQMLYGGSSGGSSSQGAPQMLL
jgi:hypothetical protein